MSMKCETMHEMILIYADCPDEIADLALKNEYLQHLDECSSCRTFRSEILQTIQLVKDCTPEVPLRDGKTISDSVLDTLNNPQIYKLRKKRNFFRTHVGTIAAVFIVAIVLAVTNNDTFRTIFDRTFLADKSALTEDSATADTNVYRFSDAAITSPGESNETAEKKAAPQAKADDDTGALALDDSTVSPNSKPATVTPTVEGNTGSDNTKSRSTGGGNDSKTGNTSKTTAVKKEIVTPTTGNATQTETNPGGKSITEEDKSVQKNPTSESGNAELHGSSDQQEQVTPKAPESPVVPKSEPPITTTAPPSTDTNENDLNIGFQIMDKSSPKSASGAAVASVAAPSAASKQFSDYVANCNQMAIASCTHPDKDQHTIPFELASQITFEEFRTWFGSLTDLETWYTVDNFKKAFGLT